MRNGDNELATDADVPPANPSRERTPAAVQFGTVAINPSNAAENDVLLFVSCEDSITIKCALLGLQYFKTHD